MNNFGELVTVEVCMLVEGDYDCTVRVNKYCHSYISLNGGIIMAMAFYVLSLHGGDL